MATNVLDDPKATIAYLAEMAQNLLRKLKENEKLTRQYPKFLREAADCISEMEKENSSLLVKINELESLIEEYRQPQDIDVSWSPEDEEKNKMQPSWRYIKPYQQILSRITKLYPGLYHAIKRSIREEKKHFYNTRVVVLENCQTSSEYRLTPDGDPLPLTKCTCNRVPIAIEETSLDESTQEKSQNQDLTPSISPDLAKSTANAPTNSEDISFSIISDDSDDDVVIIDSDVLPNRSRAPSLSNSSVHSDFTVIREDQLHGDLPDNLESMSEPHRPSTPIDQIIDSLKDAITTNAEETLSDHNSEHSSTPSFEIIIDDPFSTPISEAAPENTSTLHKITVNDSLSDSTSEVVPETVTAPLEINVDEPFSDPFSETNDDPLATGIDSEDPLACLDDEQRPENPSESSETDEFIEIEFDDSSISENEPISPDPVESSPKITKDPNTFDLNNNENSCLRDHLKHSHPILRENFVKPLRSKGVEPQNTAPEPQALPSTSSESASEFRPPSPFPLLPRTEEQNVEPRKPNRY
ncbi:uncharacterized protein LOC122504117 [Leptopilina heterotoma]|uniref:uncharacterized protein LOC122504117 n=1 Tax=Leptopilina heterotoma TaxID=63436 RepID=UPI001CA7FBAE|nr:uncharacterized protein LOC122504117 [Leptopilina heterotoma]XP_043470965.1 uncharacterized protein LOC122504117 [Leptopilina heterotoma]XP_043470966.1 uncharacterized protein LOC122504117 [Leptopilina heterotoma]